MSWSAETYVKFERERTRPVDELLARVETPDVRRAVDLGCGPGNSTERLCRRFPQAAVTGLDLSADMLAAARRRLPDVGFTQADIADWRGSDGSLDVILANASLHWLGAHETLLRHLLAALAPGGSLAVQMPDNLDEPSHRLMHEVAGDGPWADRLAQVSEARAGQRAADWYYAQLAGLGASVDLWRTTYFHALDGGADAIVAWVEGTGLRPYLAPLSAGEREQFLLRYRAAVARAYPEQPDGRVLLAFPRLFFVARVDPGRTQASSL